MLERRGIKVSHSKKEYMCLNEWEAGTVVKMKGIDMEKVHELKYLGLTDWKRGEQCQE